MKDSPRTKQVKSYKKESTKKNSAYLPPLTQRMKELLKEVEKLNILFKIHMEEETKRNNYKGKTKINPTTPKKYSHQPKSNLVKS